MPNLFDLFKFSKLLETGDGKLSLMGVPINIIPTEIMVTQQKELVKSLGIEEAYEKIYSSAKGGSGSYNSRFIKSKGFTEIRKVLDWQVKIVTFSGWGNLEIAKVDIADDSYSVHFKKGAFPIAYGRSQYAVDFIATGFVAGGLTANVGKDLDAVETKCIARGDPFCRIEVGPPEVIKKKRIALWKKWKLI